MKLREVLKKHHVAVGTDNAFQQRARLLQALWREARGLPPGVRNTGAPLSSRLSLPLVKEELSNFLTDNIRHAVRECMPATNCDRIVGRRAGPRLPTHDLHERPATVWGA